MVASSSARHSTASAPWAGAGSICSGSSDLGQLVHAAQPRQPGVGEHDRVELAVA